MGINKGGQLKRCLCIDTSQGSSVALVCLDRGQNQILASGEQTDCRGHAENLALLIDQVIAQAGCPSLAQAKIDLVVVGQGPAPFTGLRSGLVTARVLAHSLGLPVYSVPSLDILARQTLDLVQPGQEVLVVGDARRKEVYAGVYRDAGANDVQCIFGPKVGPATEFANLAAKPGIVVCGAGAAKYAQILPSDGQFPTQVQAGVAGRIALARLAGVDLSQLDPARSTAPLYLRRPDVQEPQRA